MLTEERIITVGDLHFGVRNNSLPYLGYQERWFENNLFPSIKPTDHVMFVGDIFDNRTNISTIVLNKSEEIFKRLLSITKHVHILLGNHDIYYRTSRKVNSVKMLKNIGCNVYEEATEISIADKNILIVPWIIKDDGDKIIKMLATNNYDLCFGHFEVNGFEIVQGIIDNTGMSTDTFANCQKVFSGHYHLRNKIKNIQYVGTPYELDWGDYKRTKGFEVIDLNDILFTTFIESTGIPKHIKLNSKDTKLEDINESLITNNFVLLNLDGKQTEAEQIMYSEKINSLNPISFSIDNENLIDDTNISVNTSIKDTLGFLKEYTDLIDVPDNIDKQILFGKLSEFFSEAHSS
jgi:DNA repair exonuclease SbcCD nuclease subunit